MDKIIIKDLEIFAYHGVFEKEKKDGQKFYLTIELSMSLREAGQTDDLTKSVHYGELCHDVKAEFTKCSYDLIERAADSVAEYILKSRPTIDSVKILLKKPYAPIGLPLEYVAVEIERKRYTAYIALGASLGDRRQTIEAAIEEIKKFSTVKKTSTLIETLPDGGVASCMFLNGVIEIDTLLQPRELMQRLLGIEAALGRVRTVHWCDRVIDLDILMIDDCIMTTDDLILPHPRMHMREFVLTPLCEIAPYKMHPTSGKRIFELYAQLENKLAKRAK